MQLYLLQSWFTHCTHSVARRVVFLIFAREKWNLHSVAIIQSKMPGNKASAECTRLGGWRGLGR